MVAEIMAQLGAYLRSVFVLRLDFAALIGFVGQGFFTARFLVQWIASEKAGRSVIPVAFWFFSIGGGLILLGYALYRRDPVFILGQALGTFIYVRNLMLIARERRETRSPASAAAFPGPPTDPACGRSDDRLREAPDL